MTFSCTVKNIMDSTYEKFIDDKDIVVMEYSQYYKTLTKNLAANF
jgi:hypothetical protein